MKQLIYGALLASLFLVSPLKAADDAPPAPAPVIKAPKEAQDYFELMVGAIEDKNYEGFTAPFDDASRGFMSKPLFDRAVQMFGPHLAAGYETKFLDQAKKDDSNVYIWKLTFKDKSDDAFVVMSLKGKKIGVFFFL